MLMAGDEMPSWRLMYSVNDGEQVVDLSYEARNKAVQVIYVEV